MGAKRKLRKAFSKAKRKASKAKAKGARLGKKATRRSKRVLARQGITGAAVDKAVGKVKTAVLSEGKRQIRKAKNRIKSNF